MGSPTAINETDQLPVVASSRQIDTATWNALKTSIYPGAADQSVALAFDYCRARKLDPLQKPVHIVPMYIDGGMRDVIMPGIGLYRIQAQRSGSLAGMDEPVFGPVVEREFTDPGNQKKPKRTFTMRYPEFCKQTIHKLVGERVVSFTATVYWTEEYATASRNTDAPNSMWEKRAFGQISKCAEAQALRKAFPEIDQGPTAEEMAGKSIDSVRDITPQREHAHDADASSAADALLRRHAAQAAAAEDAEVVENIDEFLSEIAAGETPQAIGATGRRIADAGLSDASLSTLRKAMADRKAALKAKRDAEAKAAEAQQPPPGDEADPDDLEAACINFCERMSEAQGHTEVHTIMGEATAALASGSPEWLRVEAAGSAALKRLEA